MRHLGWGRCRRYQPRLPCGSRSSCIVSHNQIAARFVPPAKHNISSYACACIIGKSFMASLTAGRTHILPIEIDVDADGTRGMFKA